MSANTSKKSNVGSKKTGAVSKSAKSARPAAIWIGLLCLILSTAASFMLVVQHLGGMALPGCGVGSACDAITNGPWGKIPGVNFPISSIGLAYFAAFIIAWWLSAGNPPAVLRWVARLGVFGSLVLLVVMLGVEKTVCVYCLVVHVGNLGFWAVMEFGVIDPATSNAGRGMAPFAAVFVLGAAALAGVEFAQQKAIAQRKERDLAQTTQELIQRSASQALNTADATSAPQSSSPTPPNTSLPEQSDQPQAGTQGFVGRWRLGPEVAQARVVIFSDYQCPDCRMLDGEAHEIYARYPDRISITAKHFPMDPKCNPHLPRRMHDNACWAARAAECAGQLYGNEGFWKMHDWLFEVQGFFETADQLKVGLARCGFDAARYLPHLETQATLDPVLEDIEEAWSLGLHFTPLVYVNGVEIRGAFNNPGALTRTIEALLTTNPPAATAANDVPPASAQKHVDDWAAFPARRVPPDAQPRFIGPQDAPHQIIMWSDYRSAFTGALEAQIRQAMAGRDDVQYSFRHHPIDKTCNRNVNVTISEHSCTSSKAAEAAALLGGDEAFWAMHAWLLENYRTHLNEAKLREAATSAGLDPEAFLQAMNGPQVEAAVQHDIQTGQIMLPAKQGFPLLYINGRWVSRWNLEGHNVVKLILEAASQ